jgi:hypothetical protein
MHIKLYVIIKTPSLSIALNKLIRESKENHHNQYPYMRYVYGIWNKLTIYAPMIYTAPCVRFLMRADTLCGEVEVGLALEISSFVGPCEIARADRRCNLGPKNNIYIYNIWPLKNITESTVWDGVKMY